MKKNKKSKTKTTPKKTKPELDGEFVVQRKKEPYVHMRSRPQFVQNADR